MQRVRRKQTKNRRRTGNPVGRWDYDHAGDASDDSSADPLGLKAVEETVVAEVSALAGPRYARNDERLGVVRWGAQRGFGA